MTPWNRRAPRRLIGSLVAFTLAATSVFVLSAPAQAAAQLSLTKSAPGSVLIGEQVTYRLTVSNPGDEPLYNVSFRDVLPDGVRYVGGSTSPAELGEPEPTPPVINGVGEQIVIWSNVTDLQPGSTTTLTFRASVDTTIYPVGSSFTNSATAFGSINPRVVPKFLPNGTPIPSASVVSDDATGSPTVVAPFEITKVEDSPESELLRGVHAHPTTYTLRVENNATFPATGGVLTDYLPAQLEFLGCGGVDNTRIDPGTGDPTEEYSGSGFLSGTPVPADCLFPSTVSTVSNPPNDGTTVYPPGVYTRLQWNLGTLAPGQVVTIRYAAGVPLLANTTDWTLTPGGEPTPASGLQASNLDNNSGLSTRESATEQSATNTARFIGSYAGPLATGSTNPIAVSDSETVQIEDVRLQKSVSAGSFVTNQIATFTLNVDVSEYVDASNIVLTDTLPNGYCPLSSTTNFVTGSPIDCQPVPGSDPVGADYASPPAQQLSGEFLIEFTPLTIAADGTATVTFKARMRELYTGGSLAGTPTTSGDSFVNVAQLLATTDPIPGTDQGGSETVLDESSATQVTDALSLNKSVLPRAVPQACTDSGYVDDTAIADPGFDQSSIVFRKGDRVCFKLNVDFPTSTAARNVVITDFIPDGTRYEAGTSTVSGGLPASFNEAAAAAGDEPPTWNVGFPTGIGDGTFVPAGSLLELRFSVIVDRAADGASVDITGNLMKMRTESSTGQARSYRDQVPFAIAPAPPVPVVKGVAAINGTDLNAPPAPITPAATGRDGDTVAEGDVVTFRVDITNDGDDANSTGFTIRGLQVWDVLPAGIDCSRISSISPVSAAPGAPVGTCTNPLQSGHPSFSLQATRSAITWVFRNGLAGDPDQIADGQTRTLTYDMTIPTPSSVGSIFENTAYVRSFDAFTNQFDVTATYYPADNVDTGVDPADYSGPPSSDVSSVVMPNTTFVKDLVTTSLNEQSNNALAQAVNGEGATYRVRLDIPARTSIFNGQVTDPLAAASWILDSAALTFYPDAGSSTPGAIPGGITFGTTTGTLALGTTYTNSTSTPQRFEITLNTRVNPTATAGTKTNTATFRRTPLASGGTQVTQNDTAAVAVRIPSPQLTKSNNGAGGVQAGQTITYTLRATNTVNTPPAHDTVIVDCLPAGLTFGSYGVPTQGATVAAIPGDGIRCAPTATQLQWNVGTVLGGVTPPAVPGADPGETLTYTAVVNPAAAGGATYTNTATLASSTLPNGVNNPAVERVFGLSRPSSVDVRRPTGSKTVSPSLATIGQRVTYTATSDVPAGVNFYDATVIDTLPKGIDASSLQIVGITCVVNDPGSTPCAVDGTPLTPISRLDGSTSVGWYLGNVLSNPFSRTIQLRYSAVVADNPGPQPERGDPPLQNTVTSGWFLTPDLDDSRPFPNPDTTFDRNGDTFSATVTVQEPNVALAKSVSDTTPGPGETFTYTVDVTNANSSGTDPTVSPAFNLQITDAVPNGVVVLGPVVGGVFTPDGDPSDGGGTILWLIDRLDPGDSTTRTYLARLADSPELSTGPLINTVQATSYRSLDGAGRTYSCPGCPQSTATVTPAFPRLEVIKDAVGGEPAYIDTDYAWRISVTNTGASTAFDVGVTDSLPANWRYVAGTSVITRPSGTLSEAPSDSTILGDVQSLEWSALADLLPGETLIVDFEARPLEDVVDNPTVGFPQRHINDAAATAVDGAGFPGYGTPSVAYADDDDASTRIDSADVVITKSHDSTPGPAAGETFDWVIDVRNDGDDVAVGPFTVSDDLPDGVLSAGTPSGAGWTCTAPTVAGAFTCQRTNPLDTLADGASFASITVPVSTDPSTPEGTPYANTAAVVARTYDPDTDNNSSTDTVTMRTEADVKVLKALVGDAVAGQNATYTLDVSNDGPSTALGTITVTDTLPAGSTLVSADGGSDWDCPVPTATSGVLLCTYEPNSGDLLPGTTTTITVVVAIPADQADDVVNTVDVESPITFDPDTDNNRDEVTTGRETSADLAITKTSRGELVAGRQGTYRFSVDNLGPSDAQDVTVLDDLPAGLSYSGFADVTGTWACSAVGQDVTCNLAGPLADGGSAVVDIEVDVASNVLGGITNTAEVTTTTDDPVDENNTSTDVSDFDAQADVFIVKTDAPDPVVAGEQLTYTLRVGNEGPSDAQGPIVVTDDLPDDTSFVSVSPNASGSPWSCDESAGTITCTRTSTLDAGDDGTGDEITIVVDVDPTAGPGTITNTAIVDSQTTPEIPGGAANNTDTVQTTVEDQAELVLSKATTGDSTIVAGDPAGTTFTITVTNQGPSTADDVVVTDTMPAGLIPTGASGAGWDCDDPISGQVVTCRRDSLDPGTSTITVEAKAAASVLDEATLVNAAEVTTTTPGDDPDNNDDTSDVEVIARADLALTKTHPSGTYLAGDDVVFTLRATNNGFSDAQPTVRIDDVLPPGLVFLSASTPWSCVAEAVTVSGQEVSCTLAGTYVLPAGSDAPDLDMTVRIDADADPGDYENTAVVSSGTIDPDESDNDATDSVAVDTEADLSITKTHTEPVRIGDDLTFTVTVTNGGPSQARNVEVIDTLPDGLTYVSSQVLDPDGSCAEDQGVITCGLDDPLPPQASAEIEIVATVEVAAYPTVVNSARVTSTTPDPDTSDREVTDTVVVPPLVDLSITKEHTDSFIVGQQADYLLTVRNDGPTQDPGVVTVTDTLPAGLTYVSASGGGFDCSAAGQLVTCERADALAVGGSAAIVLTVSVGPEAATGVVNQASVGSPSEDRDPDNNNASDPTDVVPLSNMGLVKELESLQGTRASYRLTATNLGPNATSTNVVLTDVLPKGLTFVSAGGAGWTCGSVAPTVTCVFSGVLQVDQSSSVSLVTEVVAAPGQVIVNTASISGGSQTGATTTDDATLTMPAAILPPTGASFGANLLLAISVLLLAIGTSMRMAAGRRRFF